jgi:hypothetical protein
MTGLICFSLTIRLAYASLTNKLQAREITKGQKKTVTMDLSAETAQSSIGVINALNRSTKSRSRAITLGTTIREVIFYFEIDQYILTKYFLILSRMTKKNVPILHQVIHHHRAKVLQVLQTIEDHLVFQKMPLTVMKKKMNVVVLHLKVKTNHRITINVVHHYPEYGLMLVLIKFTPLVVLIYFTKVIVFFFNVCDNMADKLLLVYTIVEVYIN